MSTDELIVKYKTLGKSKEWIAARLQITVEEVERKWAFIVEASKAAMVGSQASMLSQVQLMSTQYQLLGQSLKIFVDALLQSPSPEDIRKDFPSLSEEEIAKLLLKYIVLKPFIVRSPEDSLKESIEKTQRGN